MPSIESDGMTIVAQKDTPGDLANMLNLGKSIDGGMTYRVNGYLTHGIVNEKWDFYNEIIYHTENGDLGGCLSGEIRSEVPCRIL